MAIKHVGFKGAVKGVEARKAIRFRGPKFGDGNYTTFDGLKYVVDPAVGPDCVYVESEDRSDGNTRSKSKGEVQV